MQGFDESSNPNAATRLKVGLHSHRRRTPFGAPVSLAGLFLPLSARNCRFPARLFP